MFNADLQHAEQRLRREVQARHRAVVHDSAGDGDRQLRPDRPARRHRLPSSAASRVRLRRQQPSLREEAKRARDPERLGRRRRYYTDANAAQFDPNYQSSDYNDQASRATSRRSRCRCARRRPTDVRRDVPRPNTTPRCTRCARWPPTAAGTPAMGCRRAPAGASAGSSRTCRASTTRRSANHYLNASTNDPHARQQPRRDLHVQLRPPEQQLPAAAHHRVLQRAVLRHRLEYQTFNFGRRSQLSACRRTTGSTSRSRSPASARSRICFGAFGGQQGP